MKPLTLALAQLNPTVGDIDGNAEKILAAYEKAKKQKADIVITPELSLVGYPPEDLALMPDFVEKAMAAVKRLAKKTKDGPALIIGSVWDEGERKVYSSSSRIPKAAWDEKRNIYNAAVLLDGGKIVHVSHKAILPNYSVFDEKRIFTPGLDPQAIDWRGHKLGLLVCEDVWSERLRKALSKQGAELVIVINASPFEAHKAERRLAVASAAAKKAGAPLVYVNMVGGQDDIVFDGGSFILDAQGKVTTQLPGFEEVVQVVKPGASMKCKTLSTEASLWEAMKLGLHDYVRKNGFKGVTLGLSGGIDSAITAALAVDALGKENVTGVLLPSPVTSHESVDDAHETSQLLDIPIMNIPITAGMEIFDEVLSPVFKDSGWMNDLAVGGNLQSRLRGVTLMAISNRFGWLLLTTGNKSEVAVGYTTLYGDSCGGYNVLKDLYKTQVYALARWRNKQSHVIPTRSITKAPTAELAPGQKDEDQLPPYKILDAILMRHIEGRESAAQIVAAGDDKKVVEKVLKLVRISEYKRRQSAPGVKLSPMLFGKDRRFPLTNKF